MLNTVLDYFEKTVGRFPQKIAFSDTETEISFSELEYKSQKFATGVMKNKPDTEVVAFYMDKSVSTLVGFLGSVYAGCAYTQINLRYPAGRVLSIIETVSPCMIVTDSANYEKLTKIISKDDIFLIDDLFSVDKDDTLLAEKRTMITDRMPLYINFTSGSTGKPKGVAVGHRSVIDFITNFTEIFSITEKDSISNQAPFDFDVSVKDIYSGIFTGASVHIIPTSFFMRPTELMDFMCEKETTVIIWAVSALCFITSMNALDYKCPDKLRMIMFSGEVMPIKHLNKLRSYLPSATYVNLYGPTEITCNCTYYVLDREFGADEKMPIGIPFPNEKVFILDDNNNVVKEPCKKGELCVCGTALALGYYKDSEKTSQVFVQNPNNSNYLELMYRTGDIVEIGNDMQMYYVSRKDYQVKHLGHRIELSEIEISIGAVDGVDRVCCFFDEEKDKITAVYTGCAEKKEIMTYLNQKLPPYMFPQGFFRMDTFPINKNGKIDRKQVAADYITKGEKQ